MSRERLEQAHDLILQQAYDEARELLLPLADRSSTARRWLANLDELDGETSEDEAAATPAVDEQPASATTLTQAEYQAMSETFTHNGRTQWEYREVILRSWDQHMSNIEYALQEGQSEKITIEDAYLRLLNENGQQGWEIVSEEILPQQHVRLLMKRPVL